MAYAPVMAAALSGATAHQLSHWRRETSSGAVLVPEVSARRPILYSFRDVVALRTCAFLRKETSLQKIRTALETLKRLGEREHLSQYRLVADGDSIVLVRHDEGIDLVKRPGQRLIAEMSDVLGSFVTRTDVEVPALYHPRPHIDVDPEILGGHPVISGTRVPYDNVAGLLADGVKPGSIGEYYPSVTAEAAQDALEFAQYVDSWRLAAGRVAVA